MKSSMEKIVSNVILLSTLLMALQLEAVDLNDTKAQSKRVRFAHHKQDQVKDTSITAGSKEEKSKVVDNSSTSFPSFSQISLSSLSHTLGDVSKSTIALNKAAEDIIFLNHQLAAVRDEYPDIFEKYFSDYALKKFKLNQAGLIIQEKPKELKSENSQLLSDLPTVHVENPATYNN